MTLEEFHALPEDGKHYELIDGELFVTAAPGRKHFWVHKRLKDQLEESVEETGWGVVLYAPVEVRLGGPTAVEPDLFVLRKDRLHLFEQDAVVGAPDLIVEVLSPSTRAWDLQTKRGRCERAGVLECWIADPEHDSLLVLALRDGRYVEIEARDGRVASTVVPGLVVDAAALFADLA
jgi:Uma2 family endonuclease